MFQKSGVDVSLCIDSHGKCTRELQRLSFLMLFVTQVGLRFEERLEPQRGASPFLRFPHFLQGAMFALRARRTLDLPWTGVLWFRAVIRLSRPPGLPSASPGELRSRAGRFVRLVCDPSKSCLFRARPVLGPRGGRDSTARFRDFLSRCA